MSKSFSSPELVGNFSQENFAAPGLGLISAKLPHPHLYMSPSEKVVQHLYCL